MFLILHFIENDYQIDLIKVHKTREQFGVVGPICVHCSAGVGRTAVFIGLTVILERLRCEGEVMEKNLLSFRIFGIYGACNLIRVFLPPDKFSSTLNKVKTV